MKNKKELKKLEQTHKRALFTSLKLFILSSIALSVVPLPRMFFEDIYPLFNCR